ncbi:hypothetical protein DYB32_007915 [Aphanomyces invadans]|uniref:Uncharacterized protein n=1 Tax=Aphanomyces invadans TaxID=157072 RepID=A0A418AT30_9STRA|nr:hypothetical protein DYB32_007915 [Aphanomyces invadans]
MPDCTAVLSYFSCNGDPGSTPDKDECPVQFQVGLMYDLMEFESHVKSKDNLFGSVFPGQRVGSSQQFIINGDRQCWHYGWCSSRVGQKYTHCLKVRRSHSTVVILIVRVQVFFFKHLADKKLECIDSIESDAFHITSSRVLRKNDKAGSSSGHSDTNHSKRAKSTKRGTRMNGTAMPCRTRRFDCVGSVPADLTCLLNPNEAANVVARPSPDASRAPIGLLPQPSLLPLVDIATPSGRPSAPHHQMQLHNRSNDVFFIIQILSRIADFERVPHTCQYFSLTMHHLFSVQPLLAKPPPSPPRIPHGSVMESLLSVLVTGVETALERGFLTKLRDHILTHPHDALQAYSDMLALFEHELLALGRRFPQPCDAVSAMAAQLRHAFANVLGDKHKGLVPEHVYIPDTPPTNVLDSLYMGKEFAASVLSAVHVPQWSPTSRNVQGDFSPLSGKWTRLVGTSHLIHKLCGKHRLLAQSPYGLSSSCTQLIGYLAKRNFQDNTITLEYYYWPADAASKFRKRLTRHFRMHPDDANLLEIHVCKPPPDNQLAKTPMERLTFPADWHVESSSIDTYARVVDRV